MPNPTVTFAIATHNRGPVILDCLQKVLSNGLPQSHFEIILIDNASTDSTPDLIATHFPNHPKIQLIRLNSNCGPVAKNIAIRKAKGDFIILLDDDAYPHPGAVPQMLRHFHANPNLAAAVFDVTLPDGSKDAAAYPDVFIGAGTGLRTSALRSLPNGGLLPAHFFMQAEEYDLSFRLLNAGFSIQRFWDLPLTHLKTPNARIGQRTTALDIRNNLYLLARYLPQPLAEQLAADWLARYFLMAQSRDTAANHVPHPHFGTHKKAFINGAAEGLKKWNSQRANGRRLLSDNTVERIFKFQKIRDRLALLKQKTNAKKILFADFGKNILAYYLAAKDLNLEVTAILDERLAAPASSEKPHDYRCIPILSPCSSSFEDHLQNADLILLTNMSPVQAPLKAAALRRTLPLPVIDLFSRVPHTAHIAPASAGVSAFAS